VTQPSDSAPDQKRTKRVILAAVLAVFAWLLYRVVEPFLASLAWAAILALSLWPVHRALRARLRSNPGVAALSMTLFIGVGIMIPLVVFGLFTADEASRLGAEVVEILKGPKGDEVVERLRSLPVVGAPFAEWLADMRAEPARLQAYVDENRAILFSLAGSIVSAITRNGFKLLVCLFAVYFLFLHGETLGTQVRNALAKVGGERMQAVLQHVRATVRAVVYGMVMTAIAQAILAAFGFWVAGVDYPLLLGGLTLLLSFVPFGPPIVWLPAAIGLLARNEIFWGVALLVWGAGVVSTMDNILRPLFIGQATRMPVLLVFIGVVGGILSFGMLGLFLGPVIIAVALVLWRDWVAVSVVVK
jgi:predicted PurR-regulated permease PerM